MPGKRLPLNDVSTDLVDPPALTWRSDQVGKPLPLPTRFHSLIVDHYGDLKSLSLDEPVEQVFSRALRMARTKPRWTLVREDREAGVIEGYSVTKWLRFRDDFAIRIRPTEAGSLVDMRSKSRLGRSDFGVNAARIRAFLRALQT